ncbi:Ribonuclease VapC1 [Methylacidimicrobium cyclopophantes]|uniref:Ribonuclease VapC1 n=1 Tax=Methylacidimicrobium cyclopophantes TaxID=1041766 RepID=A0A5E6MI19_9BACT|nr:PIN domain-containing protein [Methylacidimicrobium cyclopophantes]VVM07978.1 Ribonuclease VapC1 [Methylacidimicrobium cyclopophantes]
MVLDTNIVSYLLKGNPEFGRYGRHLADPALFIAFLTVAELYRWPLENGWSEERIAKMRAQRRHYAVLPYDDALAWRWAELRSACKQAGIGIGFSGSWIAATALRHQKPVVTHNRRHFERIPGLDLISENREMAQPGCHPGGLPRRFFHELRIRGGARRPFRAESP